MLHTTRILAPCKGNFFLTRQLFFSRVNTVVIVMGDTVNDTTKPSITLRSAVLKQGGVFVYA